VLSAAVGQATVPQSLAMDSAEKKKLRHLKKEVEAKEQALKEAEKRVRKSLQPSIEVNLAFITRSGFRLS
jgi:hypothetical protein